MNFKDLTSSLRFSLNAVFLFLNRLIRESAFGLVNPFLAAFLFQRLGHSSQNVIFFYILAFFLFGLLVPLGAQVMSRAGFKKTMIFGLVFAALHCFWLYFFNSFESFVWLALAIISITLFRILYWTPYHIELASFLDSRIRGRQITILASIILLSGVVAPLLAGFVIEKIGFGFLFIVASLIFLFSIVPLLFVSPPREEYSFSYFQTFRELVKRRNLRALVGYGADGAQEVIGIVIWPIFIFQVLKESYIALGAISASIVLVAIIFYLIMGRLVDHYKKRPLIKAGAFLYATGWALKAFVRTGFEAFLTGAYHSFTNIVKGIPLTTFMYEEMAKREHYIDEYTVLREVSSNMGKVLMLVVCLVFLRFFDLNWTFVLAAIASLFVSVI